MEIVEIEAVLPVIGSQGMARSEGLHLTDVMNDLFEKSGMVKRTAAGWDMEVTAAAGFLFEEVLAKYIIPDSCRIGEVCRDGIICSPDGFDVETWTLDEIKFTWKSSRNPPEDNMRWMTQIKSYCYVMKTTVARLWAYYVMGDYKGRGPQFKCFMITFKEHELAENWKMITSHASTMC